MIVLLSRLEETKGKQDPPIVLEGGAPKGKARFYALWARGSKPVDDDEVGKL